MLVLRLRQGFGGRVVLVVVLPMNTRGMSFHGRDGLRAVRLIICPHNTEKNGTARRPSPLNFSRFLAGKVFMSHPKKAAFPRSGFGVQSLEFEVRLRKSAVISLAF